jgi:very-short-patch-repair endonuclease/predicted transcriptional regulator of viral defense system
MGRSSVQSSEVWEPARGQHGVVTHEQLLELGLNADAIHYRLARGRLHPIHRAVYAVGRPDLTRHGRWMAAVLACGPDALLSHASAAALWGLCQVEGSAVEVSVPYRRPKRHAGTRAHRRAGLTADDRGEHERIPVTSPARTLIDIAPRLDPDELEAAINEANRLDLVDPESLRSYVEGLGRRPGVGVLRRILDRRMFRLTDSELERRFLRLVRGAGLSRPLTQQRVNGFRVDFYWPDLGLVVETDDLRYHRTPTQQTRDRIRDQAHTAAGLVPLRFSHAQVRYEPKRVTSILTATVARIQAGGAELATTEHLTGL